MIPSHTYISKMKLINFRNYKDLTVDFPLGRIIVTGENGSGKTNLLEAISFLSPGKGLRSASYEDVIRNTDHCHSFSVHAEIDGAFGKISVGTGAFPRLTDLGEKIRRTRINHAEAKSAESLLEWVRILWLTPAMDRLFSGPASERRRFLDILVLTVNAQHAYHLVVYEKAMKNRNRLFLNACSDSVWFESIEKQMAETGTAIAAARLETVQLLSEQIGNLPQEIGFPQMLLTLSGTLENMLLSTPAVETEDFFLHSLAKERERDRAAGRTLDGPHRSDLLVYNCSKQISAEFCSTGEQKALLISLILSHAKLCKEISGTMPILLLDEITAHLDCNRRESLFFILEKIGYQTFMTGTEPHLFSTLKQKGLFLTIQDGSLLPSYGFE